MPDPTVDPTLLTVAFVAGAALLAGWVDAVVGGGGLVQLPALLLGFPTASPAQVLATNKFSSIFGTSTSAVTYYRRVHPDLRTALPMAAVALVGSFCGASVASLLPASLFKPVIVVALIGIGAFTLLRPALGDLTALRYAGRAHPGTAAGIGAAIGFYDGILGPGTGSFLVFAMVSLLGYAFLDASAKAKIVNCATNLGALLFFVPNGYVYWGLGLMLGAANMAGGYVGARTATARGSRFIRVFFLVVVGALVLRVGWDVWQENVRPHLG